MLDRLRVAGIEALVVVGGDGTLRIGQELYEKGCLVVGVPKTIDNDLGGTDVTFGFDTALTTATSAIDKLHTTAESHHRVMVVEVMGRDAGWIALHSGIAGGADVILIPEIPFKWEVVAEAIKARSKGGAKFSIIVAAEGARPAGGEQIFSRVGDGVTTGGSPGRHWQLGCAAPGRDDGPGDTLHGVGSFAARRRTHPVRPLAGDAVWGGGGAAGGRRQVRAHGRSAGTRDHGCSHRRSHPHPQAR